MDNLVPQGERVMVVPIGAMGVYWATTHRASPAEIAALELLSASAYDAPTRCGSGEGTPIAS